MNKTDKDFDDVCAFEELSGGDTFYYEGAYYVRCENIHSGDMAYNAVNLRNGNLWRIPNDAVVTNTYIKCSMF